MVQPTKVQRISIAIQRRRSPSIFSSLPTEQKLEDHFYLKFIHPLFFSNKRRRQTDTTGNVTVTVGAGVKEVSFSADAQAANSAAGSGLSSTEYAAIAACSVLLGLIYVSSVLLYLHLRRRKAKDEKLVEVRVIMLSVVNV